MPKPTKKISSKHPPILNDRIAFLIFLVANSAAAFTAPIQDCDEVFNYWEPTHYLNHGNGLQTWEYSPEFAIRSWFYIGLHALPISLIRLLPFISKTGEFYFLRFLLGICCAFSEARLFSAVSKNFNPRIGIFFAMIMVMSPGMYHASTAYLPSSFAMYTTMNGMAAFMNWRGGLRTAQGIFWFGAGALVGWPFSGALIGPFICEEILLASINGEIYATLARFLDGTVRSLILLAIQISIDTFFYRKIVVVPWNIVKYNVFSGSERGPNIYGTEPWHFYIRNLLINFNSWFILALTAYPLLLLQHYVMKQNSSKASILRGVIFSSPFYIWLTIFSAQPHKEERFLYPAYPALALNASISLHVILSYVGSTNPQHIVSRIPANLKFVFISAFVLGSLNIGSLRSVGLATGYSAPLNTYRPLFEPGVANPGDFVCLGKEWYRFPSSYHLPHGVRAKFIRSEFRGLLPGEFSEANVGFGFYPGAWLEPSGMNDQNKEDPGKYTDVAHCQFLIDSHFQGQPPTKLEPNYFLDSGNWKRLKCEMFLDAGNTSILGRLFFIPDLPFIPYKHRRKWGQYCLLQRKREST